MERLFQLWRSFFRRNDQTEQPACTPSPPTGVFDEPWRKINEESKDDLLERINSCRPPQGVKQLRILLCGQIGAGKSSFVNSIQTALRGRPANLASTNSTSASTSFTLEFQTHRIQKVGEEGFYPFVITDIMGLESGPGGILPEDVKLVMKGHVKEGYKFHNETALSDTDHYYRNDPSLEDQFHLLVCVLPADVAEIPKPIVDKIIVIRKAARDLKIPEMALVTKIDLASKEMKDLKNVYKCKYLHKKMNDLSASVGISLNFMFPVKNYSHGNTEGDQYMDTLLLTALDHMTLYGNDFITKQLHT